MSEYFRISIFRQGDGILMSALYDSGLLPDDPILTTIMPGMILAYRLTPEDLPQEPHKVWRGTVVQCDTDTLLIEMLEPGYHNLQETITYAQIVSIEPR